MGQISDIDKLRFYREEVKHEFSLLAMRSNILVTCQSFLVVPFAILNTVADFRAAFVSVYLVAVWAHLLRFYWLHPYAPAIARSKNGY